MTDAQAVLHARQMSVGHIKPQDNKKILTPSRDVDEQAASSGGEPFSTNRQHKKQTTWISSQQQVKEGHQVPFQTEPSFNPIVNRNILFSEDRVSKRLNDAIGGRES